MAKESSSTAVVFRALVMLACLIAIPLVAVFGHSLPQMVQKLFGAQSPAESASPSGHGGEAPGFQPIATAHAAQTTSQPAALPGQVPSGRPAEPLNVSRSGSGNVGGHSDSNVVAASFQAATSGSESAPGRWPAGPDDASPAATTTAAVDQFTCIQDRLRQLGATYYLLESWGNRQQLYRFYCKMAVGGNPDYAYYFEAVDSDRIRAMGRVLEQVEAWRAGR